MAAHLVFHEVRRGTKTIGRGWRTPDPSPTPICSELPGCAAAGEWVEVLVPEPDHDRQRQQKDSRVSSFGDSTAIGEEDSRLSSFEAEEASIPSPPVESGDSHADGAERNDRANAGTSQEPEGEAGSGLKGFALPRTVSRGSIGHPYSCAGSCKYAWKRRGCKDGANCERCHLCEWRRSSRKRTEETPAPTSPSLDTLPSLNE